MNASSNATAQGNSTNRAIGMRQSGTAGNGGDPGAGLVMQIANTTGFQNLSLSFKTQSLDNTSPRTTTWVVDYALGSAPTSFTLIATSPTPLTTGNSTFTNTTVNVGFGNLLDNQPQNIWIRIVALTSSVGSGNRPTTGFDDIQLTYSAGSDVTPPTIASLNPPHGATNHPSVSPIEINFSETIAKGTGLITVANITDGGSQTIDVTTNAVTVSGSKATITAILLANKQYSVTMPSAVFKDLAGNNFAPPLAGLPGNWLFNTVPAYQFNFNTCAPFGAVGSGWSQFSVTGNTTWACTSFGYASTNGVRMNGFVAGHGAVDNEDWLISSSLNLNNFTVPALSFRARTRFAGPVIQVLVSTNYSGSGNPNAATWATLSAFLPLEGSDVWTLVDNISLNLYKTANTYIAIKYLSSPAAGAARWTIDDVNVRSDTAAPQPVVDILPVYPNFDYIPAGTISRAKTVQFIAANLTSNLTITAPPKFQLSKDNITYSNAVTYASAEAQGGYKTLYVRYAPTVTNTSSFGNLNFSSTGLNTNKGDVAGNTYPYTATLDIVNWNIEWFGSTSNGPTDDNLQQANVKKVMDSLQSDIYALSEIVDTVRLMNLANSLGGYSYKVSDFSSLAANPSSPNYATGQKLAFIYKTSIVTNVKVRGLLKTSTTAYHSWASGRFPYLMEADIVNGSATKKYHFIVIHGKAGATLSDYSRRKAGAKELKDTLDAQFSPASGGIILLGDYNDDLDSTITPGIIPALTSYDDIVKDSTDADHYKSITMPLSLAGLKSMTRYNDVIDHVIVSNEIFPDYVTQSARLVYEVESWISNYGTTTSDHYPVMSRILLPSTPTAVTNISPGSIHLKLMPNPAKNILVVSFKPAAGRVRIDILDMNGQSVIKTSSYHSTSVTQTRQFNVQPLARGTYLVRIVNNQNIITQKFVIQ